MTQKQVLTSKQKKGCLIGCLIPVLFIVVMIIIAAISDAGAKNDKKNEAEKVNDTSLTIEERLKSAVISTVGKKTNMDETRIVKIDTSIDVPVLTLKSSENLSTGLTKTTMDKDTIDILEAVSKIKEVQAIAIRWQGDFTDAYGKSFKDTSLEVIVTKETMSKIDFKNKASVNLEAIATSYKLHPALQ